MGKFAEEHKKWQEQKRQSFQESHKQWRAEKRGAEMAADMQSRLKAWADEHDAFLKDYSARFGGRNADWSLIDYVGDAWDYYSSVTQRGGALRETTDKLLEDLQRDSYLYGDDYVKEVSEMLTSGRDLYSGVADIAKSDVDFWAQFAPTQEQIAAGMDTAQKVYDGWRTENKYRTKHEGKSRDEINRAILYAEDEGEADWLRQRATELWNAEDEQTVYDRADKNLEQYRADWKRYNDAVQNLNAGSEVRELIIKEINEKYGGSTNLQGLISGSEAQRKTAERNISQLKMEEVAKTDSPLYDPEFSQYAAYDPTVTDSLYAYLNASDEEKNRIAQAMMTGGQWNDTPLNGGFDASDTDFYERLDKLSSGEIALYNYYFKKFGPEKATEYLSYKTDEVNQRIGSDIFADIQGKKLAELGYSAIAGLDQFGSGMKGLARSIAGDDSYVDPSVTQYVGMMAREDLRDVDLKWYDFKEGKWKDQTIFGNSLGQTLYDFGTTTANMTPSILASTAIGIVNPAAGAVTGAALLGASAAGNAYQEKINLGYSADQARAYGYMVGVSESVLQYALGGISKLGKGSIGILEKMDNVLAEVAKTAGGRFLAAGLSEATEEGLQSIIEPYIWQAVSGEEAQVDWQETLYSSLMGLMSGGMFEGIGIAQENVQQRAQQNASYRAVGSQIINGSNAEAIGKLTELARSLDGVSDLKLGKQAEKVSKNAKAENVGKLVADINSTINGQNSKDLSARLVEVGFDAGKAAQIADAVVTLRSNFVGLTTEQTALLREVQSDEQVITAVGEVLDNEGSASYQRSEQFDEILREIATPTEQARNDNAAQPGVNGENVDPLAQLARETVEARYAAEDGVGVDGIASAEGKAILGDEAVEVADIADAGNGKVTVKLADGRSVDATTLEYEDPGEAELWRMIGKYAENADSARALLEEYREGDLDAYKYARGIEEAFLFGKLNMSENEVGIEGSYVNLLNPTQKNTSYKLGKITGDRSTQQRQNEVAPNKAEASRNNRKQGRLHFEGDRDGLTNRQKVSLQACEIVAKALGIDVYVFDPRSEKAKAYADSNGWYDPKDGSIHINLRAGHNSEGVMVFTLAHELTHFIRDWSPAKFRTLSGFLAEQYAKKGQSVDELIRQQQLDAKEDGRTLTYEQAHEEWVADSMEQMLTDGTILEKLEQLRQKDAGLVEKIKTFIEGFVKRLRDAYKGVNAQTREGRIVAQMTDAAEQLQKLFAEAVVDAGTNFKMHRAKETVGDLVAFHNITENLLWDVLNRASLLMPSIAVTNKGLNDFGEISLLFHRLTIDPAVNQKNKLYGADAWTPTQLELKVNPKFDTAETGNVLESLRESIGSEFAEELLGIDVRDFCDKITRNYGSVYIAYAHDLGVQAAYAMETGIISQIPTNEDGSVNTERLKNDIHAELDKDAAWRQYKGWLRNISETTITSFDQASTEEILRSMEEQEASAKPFKLSADGKLVVPAIEYTSIEQLRKNKGRLSDDTEADVRAVAEEMLAFAERLGDVKDVVKVINATFRQRYSTADIMRSFNEQGFDLTTDMAEELQGLYKKAVELPTEYFEAKPHREIGMEEVKGAVVPADASAELVQALQDLGIQVVTYDGSKASRLEALNSFRELRFSKKKNSSVKAEKNTTDEGGVKKGVDSPRNDTYRKPAYDEWDVNNALDDALDHADQHNDNLIKVGNMPNFITDLCGIEGEFYIYRNHAYENMVSMKDAEKAKRPTVRRGKKIHFHNLGKQRMIDAILSLEHPIMTINDSQHHRNPQIVMLLPVRGNNDAPLYAALSFYSDVKINGNFSRKPHIVLTISEREMKGSDGFDGHLEVINKAIEKGNVLSFDREKMRDYLSVIANHTRVGNITSKSLFTNIAQFQKFVNEFREKNKIKYKIPAGKAVSDRAMLVDLFEQMVTDSNEYRALQNYKKNIDQMLALEEKVDRLTEEIKRVSFAEGPRNMEYLDNLKAQRKQAVAELNKFDNILLGLEKSGVLRAMIERNRAVITQESRDKARAYYRQRNENREAEIRQYYRESRRKAVERHNQAEVRQRIRKDVQKLDSLLNKGTKEKNVKLELQEFAGAALRTAKGTFLKNYNEYDMIRNGVNNTMSREQKAVFARCQELLKELDQIREERENAPAPDNLHEKWDPEADLRRDDREEALKKELAKNMKILRDGDVFKVENELMEDSNAEQLMDELMAAYKSLQDSESAHVREVFSDAIYTQMDGVKKFLSGKAIKDMTAIELGELHKMYRLVLHTINTSNDLFAQKRKGDVRKLGEEVITQLQTPGKEMTPEILDKLAKMGWANLKPETALELIGSETLTGMMQGLYQGEDTYALDIEHARKYAEEQGKKYGRSKWDLKKSLEFANTKITLGEAMSLYAYTRRQQAQGHLEGDGFTHSSNVRIKEPVGKLPVELSYIRNATKTHSVPKDVFDRVAALLTPEQKKYVEAMQEYLSQVMGAKGNEVSMQLYGIPLFEEKVYFPLKTASEYHDEALGATTGEVKLKNSGFTQKVQEKASNPIVLDDFESVWAAHVDKMSLYHGFVLPMEDFDRVYNYHHQIEQDVTDAWGETYKKVNVDTNETVKVDIQNKMGKAANDYIEDFMRQLNGGVRSDPTEKLFGSMVRNFKKTAVLGSLSVVVQQPTAFIRAMAYLNPRDVGNPKDFLGKAGKPEGRILEEMYQYAPVALMKHIGGFDPSLGKSTNEYIFADNQGVKAKIDNFFGSFPEKMDEWTWSYIWICTKRQIHRQNPDLKINSKEFLEKVGERFSKIIRDTQVYDSVLTKSRIMRSKNVFLQMSTAFMNEPTTAMDMYIRSTIQAKRGKISKGQLARTWASVVGSQILTAAVSSFVYAMRDDDDDETYWEKYISSTINKAWENTMPWYSIPFVKDIFSIFDGYTVERSDMALIGDLHQGWQKLQSDKASPWEKTEAFAGSILNCFGIPLKNVSRDVRRIFNVSKITIESIWPGLIKGASPWPEATNTGLKTAVLEGLTGKKVAKSEQLQQAVAENDAKHILRVMASYNTEESAASALRSAVKAAFLEGNVSEEQAAEFLQVYTGDVAADAQDRITEWRAEKETGIKYDDIKDKFIAGEISGKQAKEMYITYGGQDEEDAEKKVTYWKFKKEHPESKLDQSPALDFVEFAEPAGIGLDVYTRYVEATADLESDKDEDGKTIANSKRDKVWAEIHKLPISKKQKDALHYAAGYKESSLEDAPWH
ncbi:MAG: hypothetical protein IKA47_12490 [Oscillospiraceae bacterium]|nr:hypothetical protein [Oscillospiraceae bacterium]